MRSASSAPTAANLDIKTLPDALALARQQDLDLVEVAPMANPPVCRIMDYGKFRYEESQKAKESRKKTVQVSIKEVKFRPKIGKGDFDTKVRHMQEFLAEGHKVKVTLQFRGREMAHPELGSQDPRCGDRASRPHGKVETQARLEGRNMTMVLAPEKKAVAKKAHEPRPHGDTERSRGRRRRVGTGAAPNQHEAAQAEIADVQPPADRSAPKRSRHGRSRACIDASTPDKEPTMPKMKTSKTAAKRFSKTGTGKLGACSRTASTCSRRSRRPHPPPRRDGRRPPRRRQEDQAPARRALIHGMTRTRRRRR